MMAVLVCLSLARDWTKRKSSLGLSIYLLIMRPAALPSPPAWVHGVEQEEK